MKGRMKRTSGQDKDHRRPRHRGLLLGVGLVAVVTVGLLGTAWGSFAIPPRTILTMVWRKVTGGAMAASWPDAWETVVFDIRLPRIVLSALVGAALSQGGAVYQGLFRNPLADPYLIGVSAGAGLGATAAIAFGSSISEVKG